jgi:hypothetical protein
MIYYTCTIERFSQGWLAHPQWKGGDAMTVFEALLLMLTFGLFIIAMLSFLKRK